MLVKDIMTRDVVCVREDMSLSDLASLFTMRMLSGAPVVDSRELLVGVVSLADLAAFEASHRPSPEGGYYYDLPPGPVDVGVSWTQARVRDVMSKELVFVLEHTPVQEVAEAMLKRRIHRVPVVRDRRVVGTVTTTDLVRLLLETFPAPASDSVSVPPPAPAGVSRKPGRMRARP